MTREAKRARTNERPSSAEWRVFCAVELPAALHERIRQHISKLTTSQPDGRASWSRPENTHLTLKFFGNVDESRIPQISAAATRAVNSVEPFEIAIAGTGAFPGLSRTRVLWIGVEDPNRKLRQLQSRLDDECAKENFPKEARDFQPHLTIARIRRPNGARVLAEAHLNMKFQEVIVEVKELIVFRSELNNTGSKYTALSRHPFVR